MSTIKISSLKGQRGQIYVARKGTATIICLDDGRNFRVEPCGQTATPVADVYWTGSIEWLGGYVEHWTFGIRKTAVVQKHPAKPLTETPENRWERLESIAA